MVKTHLLILEVCKQLFMVIFRLSVLWAADMSMLAITAVRRLDQILIQQVLLLNLLAMAEVNLKHRNGRILVEMRLR